MAEGPGPSNRPDDTYSVAGRIETRPSRRGRAGILLVALVVVVWASATLGGRLGGRVPPGGSAGASESAQTSGGPGASPTPISDSGYLPALEEPVPDRVAGRLPVVLGGLAWLDLSLPRIDSTVDLSLEQWLFALPFGELACVCLADQPNGGHELLLRRYGESGALAYANPVLDWLSADENFTLVDAAPTPDGAAAIVASVVTEPTTFRLRVERYPLSTDDSIGFALVSTPIDLTELGDPGRLTVRVMVAPDGSLVRVTLQRLADDLAGITGLERSWTIPINADQALGFGAFVEEPPVPEDVAPATCTKAALATPTDVAALCTSLGTDPTSGLPELFVRLNHQGRYQDVDLGPILPGYEVPGFQVDGTRGLAYVWEAFAHRLVRVTVATGGLDTLTIGDGTGRDLPTFGPGASPTEAPPDGPPVDATATLWQPIESSRNVSTNLLAGSPDGRLLYAGGLVQPTGAVALGVPDSSGIWVVDTASLKPVARWDPVATYDNLALSPDGQYLVAVGSPSSSEQTISGNHGPQLVLYDPADGAIAEIQRSLVLRLGALPYLLPPPPPDPGVPPG